MGPIAGTINALLLAGWKPSRPDFWHVDKDTSIKVDAKPFARFQIIAQAQNDLQKRAWERASKNQHGQGLETGIPSLEPARKAKTYFKKHGLHDAAQGLKNIVVGIYRPYANDGVFGV